MLPLIVNRQRGHRLSLGAACTSVHPAEHELLTILKDTHRRWLKIAVFISAVVIAPLAEETFFRGYVQTMIATSPKAPGPASSLTSNCLRRHAPLVDDAADLPAGAWPGVPV